MKLAQLKPFFGELVTLQLKTEWWTMSFKGTVVGKKPGDPSGHICQAATRQVKDESGELREAFMGPLDLIGPVMLKEQDGALVITQGGPDGSMLETGCDPENIAYVNRCVAPPPLPNKILVP